jgi:patatin-like phospholipase/acyl hydrolase
MSTTEATAGDPPVRVLAVDGGGIRGIIPALVLAELERRTGLPGCRLFDVMAGTSTGGIIALGLSMPDERGEPVSRAAQLIEMYERAGSDIFVRERLGAVEALVHQRYPSDDIDATLARYFGETRLSGAATEVLVTAYDLLAREVVLLTSEAARADPSLDLPMRVAARATSAAPTYFEPVGVTMGTPPRHRLLVDGGIAANNPAMAAYVEVRRRHPSAGMVVVSLGTGTSSTAIPADEVRDWGMAHWGRVILHLLIDGTGEMVHQQLGEVLPDGDYVRLQTDLTGANEALDDATEENIERLKDLARALVAASDRELDRLCGLLAR